MTKKSSKTLKKQVERIASFGDREHLRSEIDVRTIMRELHEVRLLLRRGSEDDIDMDTGEIIARPLGGERLKSIKMLIDLDLGFIHLALPPLKAVNTVVRMPDMSKEDMEPQNIRGNLLQQVAEGLIAPDIAKSIAEVAGMKSELEDDSNIPQSFTVNISTVDGREVDDMGNPVVSDDDDSDMVVDGDDMGDAFIMDSKHKGE